MNIVQSVQNALSYLTEAAFRLFRPADDEYPNTGVQPYSGDPQSKRHAGHKNRVQTLECLNLSLSSKKFSSTALCGTRGCIRSNS